MNEARPAIVGVLIMFTVIGVVIDISAFNTLHVARSGGLYLDVFSLSHRRN
ncbi:MAG: hypothetical protein NXH70_09910 [Hyphomonas sp.]|nr:hypothetical protein [Hyphomonas sp.]